MGQTICQPPPKVLEDSLNLIAKLPAIAAAVYRHTFKGGDYIQPDPSLDWAANLAHMMGGCAAAPRTFLLCLRALLQAAPDKALSPTREPTFPEKATNPRARARGARPAPLRTKQASTTRAAAR